MGLLEGVRVVRSGDAGVRLSACEIADFFVDVPYAGEIVRARHCGDALKLHEGGDQFITLPMTSFSTKSGSARRGTVGCAGCNQFCVARITLPVPANRGIFAGMKRPRSLLSCGTK